MKVLVIYGGVNNGLRKDIPMQNNKKSKLTNIKYL